MNERFKFSLSHNAFTDSSVVPTPPIHQVSSRSALQVLMLPEKRDKLKKKKKKSL